MRLHSRRRSGRLHRIGRRPGRRPGIRRFRVRDGHARGARCSCARGSLRLGPRHRAQRLRVGCALVQLLRPGGRGARAHSRWRGRSGPGGHPAGAGSGRGGIRHGQRPEAAAAPVAGREPHIRQPPDQVWRGDPRGDRRRGRSRCAEQPDQRGLHRCKPLLPRAGRSIRRDGEEGHPQRGGDGGGAPRRVLRHPGAGRPEEDRPCGGWSSAAGHHGAALVRRSWIPSSTAGGRWPRRARRWTSCARPGTSARSS